MPIFTAIDTFNKCSIWFSHSTSYGHLAINSFTLKKWPSLTFIGKNPNTVLCSIQQLQLYTHARFVKIKIILINNQWWILLCILTNVNKISNKRRKFSICDMNMGSERGKKQTKNKTNDVLHQHTANRYTRQVSDRMHAGGFRCSYKLNEFLYMLYLFKWIT